MPMTASQLCDAIRSCATIHELDVLWATAPKRLKDEGEVVAAYDYRKACLENPIAENLGAG